MASTAARDALPPPRRGARDTPGDDRIARIQDRLRLLGLTDDTPDGDFGPATETALRRFQWFVGTAEWRLRVPAGGTVTTALVEPFARNPAVTLTGGYDLATALEMKLWADGGFQTTGLLVRVPFARYARLERGPTMTTLQGIPADQMLVDEGFVPGLASLDAAAAAGNVTFRLNQAFRVQGAVVRGAIVTPATRSQHLIGRALDGNVVEGGRVWGRGEMAPGRHGPGFARMIEEAKRAGLRWGGEFPATDPVHFDAQVAATSEEYEMRFFFAQRAYRERHPVRAL